jgi:hypothetical protein
MNKLQVLGSPLGGVVTAPFLREHFSALASDRLIAQLESIRDKTLLAAVTEGELN